MAVPIWNFCSKAFQSVSGHCIYLVNKKEQNLDFYTKFQIRNINRFLVKLFLVKESYTILRIACGRGRRPRRSPQRAKSSYIVRSARDVNKRTASCTLQNSPVDCFGRGDALQERACPSGTLWHKFLHNYYPYCLRLYFFLFLPFFFELVTLIRLRFFRLFSSLSSFSLFLRLILLWIQITTMINDTTRAIRTM